MDNVQNKELNFFRLKTEWMAEGKDGGLSRVKTEELVMATSYTEAEKVAYAIAENQSRGNMGSFSIEIVKTKISDIIYNNILAQDDVVTCGMICNYFEEDEESGVGLYSVKVVYITVDEKSGREKRATETLYVPATSNADATSKIDDFVLENIGITDYVIRDTKFDKAEAIYWPVNIHQNKVKSLDLK